MKNLPVWDLSAYYSGLNDPKIQADMAEGLKLAEVFEKKYRGKITEQTTAQEILESITLSESITLLAHKPVIFAMSVKDVDNENSEAGALLQKTLKHATEVGSKLTFYSLALNNLTAEKLNELADDPLLSEYRYYLKRMIIFKPHRLSEQEEIILQKKSLTSSSAFGRLFDEERTRLRFPLQVDGEKVEYTIEEVSNLLHDSDREKRKAASESIGRVLNQESKLTAFIMNTLVEDKEINDSLTKFTTPDQSRHLDNDIDPKVVDAMVSVVSDNYSLVEDYYNHKKQWLGYDHLFDYDRYAPFSESKSHFSYEEAKDLVLNAFRKFSPEFEKKARMFFDNSWIHAPVMPEKRGGAYCQGGTPDRHPLILLNYKGRIEDVSTMAHELGHGINDLYLSERPVTNYGTFLVLAETASVFAEMLLFDDLKEKITDKEELFSLYAGKIERIIATVYRQTSMHQFEMALHNKHKTDGELAPEIINQLWLDTQTQMFGKSMSFTENYKHWWGSVPHFFHWPFYVYSYAFGEMLVFALYAKYKQEGQAFVPKYIELMKAGLTASPQELLAPLGIDLNDRKFWQAGIDMIQALIEETKQLRK